VSANLTLREAGALVGVFIGSAANYYDLNNASDPTYTSTLNAQYDLNTAENGCKFPSTEPADGQFDFQQCDFVAKNAITSANGTFRG
jgi:GH35 family endo-1,4-beta-xylanase